MRTLVPPRALFGIALLLVGAAFLATRGVAPRPTAGKRAPTVAAAPKPPPSAAFKRANWSTAAPEEEPSAYESFFAEREEPVTTPASLKHLDGVEIVFTAPEEDR